MRMINTIAGSSGKHNLTVWRPPVPFLPARRYARAGISRHRVYVCLSVTRRYCIKTAKPRITQTTPRDSPGTLVFWRQESSVDDPLSPEICAQSDPPRFRTPQFRSIFAHSASNVRAGKKVQLALIGSRPRAFQRAIDRSCTLPLSPANGGTKRDFVLPVKSNFCRKTSATVSLCGNFQPQSCSYIIPPSNGP